MEIFELIKENKIWLIKGNKVFKPCSSRTNARKRVLAYYDKLHPGITHERITIEEIKDEGQ